MMENYSPENETAFAVGESVLHTSPAGRQAERVYLEYIPGARLPYMICTKEVWGRIKDGKDESKVVIFADNIERMKHKVRLTLKDISEGKGVGVDPELIEIIDK